MKKLLLLLFPFLLSCEGELSYIGQEIVDGKISAVKKGVAGDFGRHRSTIWVQTPTSTRKVDIPFEYENRWKVGDTCLLIIEKYKENK
jgi:hypothetical protein